MFRNYLCVIVLISISIAIGFSIETTAQNAYEYGTVVGGDESNISTNSFLQTNEEGYQITLINSSGGVNAGSGGSSQSGQNVKIINVPKDTDYLELLVFYAKLNPRFIRKNKIKIYRVEDAGPAPYLSKNINRYWTEYNFREQYKKGGPFDKVKPGDIIFVQRKGLLNRPIFDPLSDLRFILTLPSLALSVYTLYNAFK
jgi:hypothetical protein